MLVLPVTYKLLFIDTSSATYRLLFMDMSLLSIILLLIVDTPTMLIIRIRKLLYSRVQHA
jgi:hypothetical protein